MKVPASLLDIAETLKKAGKECYVVGGAVRDFLQGSTDPHDFDLATNALPSEVQNLFSHTISTGILHGTVTIITPDQKQYEITTYRKDGKYSDGRRPDVVEAAEDIEIDLSRRDFTMNAVAYDPLNETFKDPFAGSEDIKNKTIKCVGNAKDRFLEDGLRIIRTFRFIAKYNFRLDEEIIQTFADKAVIDMLDKISAERIRDELNKILMADHSYHAFALMNQYGVLEKIIPELKKCDGFPQNGHHKYNILEHTFLTVHETGKLDASLEVRLAALLHDIGKPDTAELKPDGVSYSFHGHEDLSVGIAKTILERLKYSNAIRDKVLLLIDRHMAPHAYNSKWSKSAVRRFVIKVGAENLSNLYLLNQADITATGTGNEENLNELQYRVNEILSEQIPLKVTNMAVNGTDLMDEVGFRPGPALGKVLKVLFEAAIDNPELNTRERLIDMAKDLI